MQRQVANDAVTAIAQESLPAVVCSVLLAGTALFLPDQLSSDGWLALVSGRLIAKRGLPHHDALATLTAGREWIDQQWLGQLATYGLHVGGGIRLLLAANVVLVVGAFVAAVIYARRRGGHPTTVAVVALVVLVPFLVTSFSVRTQSFVYLPFVAVVALLTRPLIKVQTALLLLAVLILWANVHGSALLVAALIALRGATSVVRRRRNGSRHEPAWLLVLAPWPCLLASPYHVQLVTYYAKTVFSPSFSRYLSQWAPTAFSPISAPLLLSLFATVWMLGRSARSYSVYERWLVGVAVMLGLLAVRNWTFAGLLVLMFAPVGFDGALRTRPPRPVPRVGAVIAVVAATGAVAFAVDGLGSPEAELLRSYPAPAADAAALEAKQSGATVYGGIQFSDWLLWTHPELAGKVVFDVRYELLRKSELKQLVLFDNGSETDEPLGDPGVFVLDPSIEKHAVKALRATVRTVYDTDHALVSVRHAN